MKLALREGMAPGASLPERLAWLERVGLEGIELHGGSLDLPPDQLKAILAGSSIGVANVAGSANLLHSDPAERATAIELTQARLRLAGELGAAGVLVVPQFGRRPELPDLAPLTSAVELERELLVLQLRALAPTAREAGGADLPRTAQPLRGPPRHPPRSGRRLRRAGWP